MSEISIPAFRYMRLADIAPNFRINDGYIEIPKNYGSMMPKFSKELSDMLRQAIHTLCREAGESTYIYDESSNDYKARRPGYKIPLERWYFVMSQKTDYTIR